MKTIHLCTSASWGGLEVYACTVMLELQRAGCDVLGICAKSSKVHTYLTEHKIPVQTLPGSYAVSLSAVRFLRSLVDDHGADILHAHFHKDIWPASLALTFDERRKLFLSIYLGVPKKKDVFHRLIYNRINGIFTSSHELCRRLPGLYPVPPSKIHYLPYGRSLERYRIDAGRRKELRSSFGCGDDDFLIGTMVRIDPGKGVMDFARSYESLSSSVKERARYLIIGEPTRKSRVRGNESPFEPESEMYFEQVQAFIRQAGIADRVRCVGYQPDLIGFLGALDVFVFPSRDELYSLVVLDAMAMGLPVVAAAAGGTLDQVEDQKSGLFYPVGDSRAMAERISSYLGSRQLRDDHGARARKFVERHHSMDGMIRQLMDYYQNLS